MKQLLFAFQERQKLNLLKKKCAKLMDNINLI